MTSLVSFVVFPLQSLFLSRNRAFQAIKNCLLFTVQCCAIANCEEEQHLHCGSAHPCFQRLDQSLTYEALSAGDYVDRGDVAENKRPCGPATHGLFVSLALHYPPGIDQKSRVSRFLEKLAVHARLHLP